MDREIGGEFWTTEENEVTKQITINHHFLLTGRTALEHIIKDIKVSREFNKIYMPSYCCDTMIHPFLDNGVEVEFYDIKFANGKYVYEIETNTQCDTLLIMQYFGFFNETVNHIIDLFKKLGKTVIEDCTHSFFSDSPFNIQSDYVFFSYRKWTGMACGAIVIKQSGDFNIEAPKETNLRYLELRKTASLMKKDYIENKTDNKHNFLSLFNQAEELLSRDYKNYNVPDCIIEMITSLDIAEIKKKRKLNSGYLIEGLRKHVDIEMINQTGKDVPLFVPIIVYNGKRDGLRKYLIDNSIYCPVHWPVSEEHKIKDLFLYENSLSLVCDQRYDVSDMNRIVKCINSYFGKDG